jgi:hypothetical protein
MNLWTLTLVKGNTYLRRTVVKMLTEVVMFKRVMHNQAENFTEETVIMCNKPS